MSTAPDGAEVQPPLLEPQVVPSAVRNEPRDAAPPRIALFSGGSALHDSCPALARMRAATTHLVTTFDSGGSSGALRHAFDMPAVGDLRRRVLSLADEASPRRQRLVRLLDLRLPDTGTAAALSHRLDDLAHGSDPEVLVLDAGDRLRVTGALTAVVDHPRARSLDLRGASVGNLVIAGLYFENGRRLAAAITEVARWVGARGDVRPITEAALHVAAELENGRVLVGQHLLTGKQCPPIESPVRSIHLCRSPADPRPVELVVDPAARHVLRTADLVCYPIGSFYTSVVVNLLPRGTAEAIAESRGRKLYVHNIGPDPEQLGRGCVDCALILLDVLRRHPDAPPARRLLDTVVVDDHDSRHIDAADRARLSRLGIELVARPLRRAADGAGGEGAAIDPSRLAELLVETGARP